MKKPTASIAFQVLPKTDDNKKMISIIDDVIALIKQSGIRYEVGPMETTMEGELNAMLDVIRKAQTNCIANGAESVFSNVKILYNPNGVMTIKEKVTKHR